MRGGKREGAGRKQEVETVIVPIRTTATTRAALKELAARHSTPGRKTKLSVGEMLTRLAFDKEFREKFGHTEPLPGS